MPRVPVYQPNQIGPVETTGARFRAADFTSGAEAIGRGMQRAGSAMAQFAADEDQRQAKFEDIYARQLALRFKTEADPVVSAYGQLQGKNAVDQGAATQERLAALRESVLAEATTPRMKAFLEERIMPIAATYQGAIGEHSSRQMAAFQESTLRAEVAMAGDEAIKTFERPDLQGKAREAGLIALSELGALKGWGAEELALERQKFVSGIHAAAVQTALANDDVDMAAALFEANADEMTAGDRLEAQQRLRDPLDRRAADMGLAEIIGSLPGGAVVEGDLGAGGYDRASIKALIRGPESGGNDRAVNGMGSSASGRYQFVRGTFTDLYSKVYGVDAAAAKQAWDRNRFDPVVQERLMDRLLQDNEKALRSAGLPISNGNMYVMHVLGSGDGLKMLRAGANEPVSKYLSSEIIRQNPTYFGGKKTVGQALAVVRGKVAGTGAGTAPAAFDKAAIYAAIDARSDWTPEQKARVRKAADNSISSSEELLGRQQREADNAAAELVLAQREGFTNVNRIPRAVWNSLSVADKAKYEGIAERNRQPKTVDANGSDQIALNTMRFYEPDKFKTLNLAEYVGRVTPAELDTLMAEQAKMRTAKPGAFDPRTGITSALSYGKKLGGLDLSEKDESAIMQIMEDEARALNAAGKPVDYNALFLSATRNVATRTWLGRPDAMPRYQLSGSNMTDEQDARVRQLLTRQLQREPTDDEVLRYFRANFRTAPRDSR